MKSPLLTTVVLAALAIIAFAGNSLLARAALADGAIEVGAYSAIRLLSGALVLLPFLGAGPSRDDLPAGLALAAYVAAFSLAYVDLGAGLGALILFGFVQATVLAVGLLRGERLIARGWLGAALALAGLIYVLAPWQAIGAGLAALWPGLLMASAGIAWGAYTVIGRGAGTMPGGATGSTARNFLIASVIIAPMALLDSGWPGWNGAILAVISGVVTSALGYVVWYKVAPRLGLATIASVQLATPVVAALGGVMLLSEELGASLLIGGALILGGIVLTLNASKAAQ
ncbi:MAG: DMT family transporter [Erythrobacter sp.]